MLSGIGVIEFDGPIVTAEILLVLAYRVVGRIGFEPLARRILNTVVRAVRPARAKDLAEAPAAQK
jgi:hypothetical protein